MFPSLLRGHDQVLFEVGGTTSCSAGDLLLHVRTHAHKDLLKGANILTNWAETSDLTNTCRLYVFIPGQTPQRLDGAYMHQCEHECKQDPRCGISNDCQYRLKDPTLDCCGPP